MRRTGTVCGLAALWALACAPSLSAQIDLSVPVPILQARRSALFDALGSGIAVLRSASPLDFEEHPQASDFRQDDDFYYLTGLETPDSWLVLIARESGPDSALLYLPPRNAREERWTGPRLGPGREAVALTGVSEARSVEAFEDEIAARLQVTGARLYLPLNPRSARYDVFERLAFANGLESRDLDPVLASLRLVKDSVEIARLRRAVAITTEALREAMRAARPGMYEYEIEAIIEVVFRRSGAERVGFPGIVGSGPNSVVLHYDENRRQVRDGEVVVIDVGAEYAYYTADVTRTIPVGGTFTPRQRAIYELVLSTQEAVIAAVRPGVTFAELERLARKHMRENSGSLCAPRTCDEHFVHRLGHWLGMDVHDVGDYRTPFRPGMVLAIEPGIYLPEESLGVRIEDDLLVTDQGAEFLSAGAPRTPSEIEALMRQKQHGVLPATDQPARSP